MIKYFIVLVLDIICITGCMPIDKNKNIEAHREIDWIYQVDSLIMPYWMSAEAIGNPTGNFPAYRYNDGRIIDHNNLDYSILNATYTKYYMNNTDSLRRDFLRVKSRMIYGYCMSYHMTGNEEYLVIAKRSLEYLKQNGAFAENSAVSFWDIEGNPRPEIHQRNTQDLAYALLGPTAYYYLTRDAEVLELILSIHQFTWEKYYEQSDLKENTKLMKWVLEDFEGDNSYTKDMIGPMDQLNAYLLLLARTVPDSIADKLKNRSKILAYSLKDNFYSKDYNIFWGRLDNKTFNAPNTDFGHSIKTFWMIHVAAKLNSDQELENFAEEGAKNLLRTAYRENGSWYSKYKNTSLDRDANIFGFQYMELDQMAATMSFSDTSIYSNYLKYTYPYFEEHMIDYKYKGLNDALTANGKPDMLGFKAGWFGGNFHGMEHALIGYLSTANFNEQDIELYYAFAQDPGRDKIEPYHYTADIVEIETSDFQDSNLDGLTKNKITFQNIR